MAIERRDRVKDSTTTTGTGTVTLSGTAPNGYRAVTDAHTNGATVRYAISLGAEWEVGEGVFTTSGNTLTRATVLASSNAGSLVNFSAGTKTVITTLTAEEVFSRAGDSMTGLLRLVKGSDIASAATVDLGTATGNSVDVTHSTGTTAITSLGGASLQAGTEIETRFVISGGTLTLTHHATNLYLAGGANITLANGDTIRWRKMHSSNAEWKMVGGVKADGTAWVVAAAGVSESAWTDYSATSTIVGWSSFTTKQIYYKTVGKTVFWTAVLIGTSNSTAVSFTLPTASSNDAQVNFCVRTTDNGTATTGGGLANQLANSTTVNCYKDMAANIWTSSGTKHVIGSGFYNIP